MPSGAGFAGAAMSGYIGMTEQQNAINAANATRQQALQSYLDLNVPDPAQQQIILQKYASTGQLDPQMEQAVTAQATQLANMQVDPQGRSAEVQALQEMSKVASSGGLDAQAQQQQAQATQAANANEAGQVGAITQAANARGTGGSGAQLAAELQGSQTDANTAAASGMSAAASAQQRALQAMTSSAQMGSNLNSADYTQAANKAAAQDAINKFNTQNSQSVNNANTVANNQAQAQNLANTQNLANANVDTSNKQEVANKALVQQQFNNEMAKANGEANAYNGVAAGQQAAGQSAANSWANIG